MSDFMRRQCIEGLKVGDTFTYSRTFSQEETERFGDLTRDYNPVHYDVRWSLAKGFDGLICHGLLVGSMICDFGGQVGWLATGMSFKFTKPVYPGGSITFTITIESIDPSGRAQARAVMTNADGEAVCHATLTGRLPLSQERELLRSVHPEMANLPDIGVARKI
jgi:3-hydroxybutyryl-CoA dehydratase